jgi:hypothetical protein
MSAADTPEAFVVNSTAGNSAPFGGRRRSGKKMRLVKKKTVRRMLKKMGLRMRGGAAAPDVAATPGVADAMKDAANGDAAPVPPMGGRRHSRKHTRRGRSKRGIFGLKY